jgi:nitronate monooxygenase
MNEIEAGGDIPPYPLQNKLTSEIRSAAGEQGKADYLSLWAGQAAALARELPAEQVVRDMALELNQFLN